MFPVLKMFASEQARSFLRYLLRLEKENPLGFTMNKSSFEIGVLDQNIFGISLLISPGESTIIYRHASDRALKEENNQLVAELIEEVKKANDDDPTSALPLSLSFREFRGVTKNLGVERHEDIHGLFLEVPSTVTTPNNCVNFTEKGRLNITDLMNKVMGFEILSAAGFKLKVQTIRKSRSMGIMKLQVVNWQEEAKIGETMYVAVEHLSAEPQKAVFTLYWVIKLFRKFYMEEGTAGILKLCVAEPGHALTARNPGGIGTFICRSTY